MSDRTTSVPSTQPQTTPTTLTAEQRAHLATLARYITATAEQQVRLQADMAECLGMGMEEDEYLEALSTWGGTVAEYLAENAPEAAESPDSAEQPEAAVAEAVQATEAEKEAAEEKARTEAAATLKAVVKAYAKGEKAYRAGLLEAGRLCGEYVRQRLALGDNRSAAVQAIEGQLAGYSSTVVDANRLIGAWEAYRLLADETGLAKQAEAVPYGHFRDGWCRLVERQGKDTAAECWVLLPDMAEDCKGVFADSVKAGLSKQAVEGKVATLLHDYAAAQKRKTEAEAERRALAAKDQQQAAYRAEAERVKAQQAAEQAVKAAEKAEADSAEKATLTAAAEEAKADLLAKQRTQQEEQAKADQAAKEKTAAERVAKEAAAAKERADKKAQKAAEKGTTKTATVKPPTEDKRPEPAAGNLLRAAATAGTAKDVASMALELITGGDEPDTVLAELLRLLDNHADLSKGSHRAIKAALVSLASAERKVAVVLPGPIAERNGHGTPATVA